MRKIIPYNPKLKQLARNLRNNSTLSEILLWQCLKGKKMKRYDFHRQKPIGNYIVDFFCNELMLAIEIDGMSHDEKINEDLKRQKQIENLGISFLRFNDLDVKKNMEGVVVAIEEWIEKYSLKHTPSATQIHPSQEGNYKKSVEN
ncbi:endonuclease domain-containing protein [Candidatus Parcubacteria bacterium]|nr:endonuclease domain-containing protein [Candidatus Parcubacteria bacterium]